MNLIIRWIPLTWISRYQIARYPSQNNPDKEISTILGELGAVGLHKIIMDHKIDIFFAHRCFRFGYFLKFSLEILLIHQIFWAQLQIRTSRQSIFTKIFSPKFLLKLLTCIRTGSFGNQWILGYNNCVVKIWYLKEKICEFKNRTQ